jgi:hypothetical protein
MPDHLDHALPLRTERTRSELRIEVQVSLGALAKALKVDTSTNATTGSTTNYPELLTDKARLLWQMRAPRAYDGLQTAAEILRRQTPAQGEATEGIFDPPGEALAVLQHTLAQQQAVVQHRPAVEQSAQGALEQAKQLVATLTSAGASGSPQGDALQKANEQAAAAEAKVALETQRTPAERKGLDLVRQATTALARAVAHDSTTAQQTGLSAVDEALRTVAADTGALWRDLADLIWQFDAYVQDQLASVSETEAAGYQLGRGLAETYWALDPAAEGGSSSWGFLLGKERSGELSRLVGRLTANFEQYTSPAVASSVTIWRDVAANSEWRNNATSQNDLYAQTRRWYELLILGQDPTTLIKPFAAMRNWRAVGAVFRQFWPQITITALGFASVVAMAVLFSLGQGTAFWKTFTAVFGVVGLSTASVSGFLKNSAQAIVKRLRQDAYTDLIAAAIQTAPPPPPGVTLQRSINERALTPATPN